MIALKKIDIGEGLDTCPTCGYTDGFHAVFEKQEETDALAWHLVCPSCHARFDPGLEVRVTRRA